MKNLTKHQSYFLITFTFILFVKCSNLTKTSNMQSRSKDKPLYHNHIRERHFAKAKKEVLHYLNDSQYEKLESYLNKFEQKVVIDFYKKEGNDILDWVVRFDEDSYALEFLIKKLPLELTVLLLQENNFSIVSSFLDSTNRLAKHGWFQEEDRNSFIKKINILLSLPEDSGIKKFMLNYLSKNKLEDSVREWFKGTKLEDKFKIE